MNKKQSLEKRTLSSTIAGGISFFLTFIQSIILVPFFLKYWGTEKYGVWLGMLAFIGMLQTLDLGHQNYVGNEFNKYYHLAKSKAQEILGSSFRFAYLLALVEFVLLLLLIIFNYTSAIIETGEINENYQIGLSLVVLMIAWVLTGSFGGILVRVILPLGLYARSVYISLTIKIVQVVILFIASTFHFSLLTTAIFYSAASLIYNVFVYIYIKNLMPEFFPWWGKGSWRTGFTNLLNSLVMTISGIFDQFRNNGIVLVISSFLSASFVPVFTTIRTIPNTALQFSRLIIYPLYPDLIRFYSAREGDKIIQTFLANWLITGMIVNLFLILFLPFIEEFYAWWTRGRLEFDMVFFLLMASGISIANFGEALYTFIYSVNNIKAIAVINLVRAVIFLSISFLLIGKFGLTGIGMAFLISELVTSLILPLFYTNRELINFGFKIKFNQVLIAALPLFILAMVFLGIYIADLPKVIFILAGLLLLTLFMFLQWGMLSSEVKMRLKNIFS